MKKLYKILIYIVKNMFPKSISIAIAENVRDTVFKQWIATGNFRQLHMYMEWSDIAYKLKYGDKNEIR